MSMDARWEADDAAVESDRAAEYSDESWILREYPDVDGVTAIGDGKDLSDEPSSFYWFVEDLGRSAVEAVIWRTAAVAAGALFTGGQVLVEALRVSAGFVDALLSTNAGRGFTLPIPMVDLNHGEYMVNLRFRLCEQDPGSFPSLRLDVGENLDHVPVPETLQVEGVDSERVRVIGVVDKTAAPSAGRGCDMEDLIRFAAEHAYATGIIGSESWAPLVVVYLRPRLRAGMLVVRPREGELDAPLWFEPASEESTSVESGRGR